MDRWTEARTTDGALDAYRREKKATSLDGLFTRMFD